MLLDFINDNDNINVYERINQGWRVWIWPLVSVPAVQLANLGFEACLVPLSLATDTLFLSHQCFHFQSWHFYSVECTLTLLQHQQTNVHIIIFFFLIYAIHTQFRNMASIKAAWPSQSSNLLFLPAGSMLLVLPSPLLCRSSSKLKLGLMRKRAQCWGPLEP